MRKPDAEFVAKALAVIGEVLTIVGIFLGGALALAL